MAARPVACVVAFVAFAVVTMGARCIENDSLRRDANGDWQIVGEIHNETDVQGLNIALGGVVDYEDGTRMQAEATMCPSALSPGTFSAYRITFANSDAYIRPSSYRVNVTGGAATADRLRTLEGAFLSDSARTAPLAIRRGVFVGVSAGFTLAESERARLTQAETIGYAFCTVLYGPDGDVVHVEGPVSRNLAANSQGLGLVARIDLAPVDATDARIIFWLVSADGTPITAARTTELIPIESEPAPGEF